MTKKTILLGVPQLANIHKNMIKNLELLNFEVIDISFPLNTKDFRYPNFAHRVYNFLRKLFLNDKSYKKELYLANRKVIKEKINSLKDIDYALFIRPDLYPKYFITKVKKKSKVTIGYQWDGLDRFPEIYSYIKLFDHFYVFDPVDVKKNLLPITNFYFDYNLKSKIEQKNSAYFIGFHIKERTILLDRIAKEINDYEIENNINVKFMDFDVEESKKYENIKPTFEYLSYEQNLHYVKECKILIDLVDKVHNGLSFRVFESLGYDKKLITNNINVKNYDLYNPNNIFIIENDNLEGLTEFLKKEYVVDDEIKEKYAFTNWIKYILKLENHIPINL